MSRAVFSCCGSTSKFYGIVNVEEREDNQAGRLVDAKFKTTELDKMAASGLRRLESMVEQDVNEHL